MLDNQYVIDIKTSMMFPKCSQKHILIVSVNMLKEGVFKDIEKASKVEFSDKDLLTQN